MLDSGLKLAIVVFICYFNVNVKLIEEAYIMKKESLKIYGVTGYTMAENNVPPLLYDASYMKTNSEDEPIIVEQIQDDEDCSHIPPMLPIISKF